MKSPSHSSSVPSHVDVGGVRLKLSQPHQAVGKWIGLDSLTEIDSVGSGSTTTGLHDVRGRFGTATQTLYVDVDG